MVYWIKLTVIHLLYYKQWVTVVKEEARRLVAMGRSRGACSSLWPPTLCLTSM